MGGEVGKAFFVILRHVRVAFSLFHGAFSLIDNPKIEQDTNDDGQAANAPR